MIRAVEQLSTSAAPEYVLIAKEQFKEIIDTIKNVSMETNRKFNKLTEDINVIKHGQKALMSEFIKLRDNRLNLRHFVDLENQKFVLPFNEINTFTNFDKSLLEDIESSRQLVPFIRQLLIYSGFIIMFIISRNQYI